MGNVLPSTESHQCPPKRMEVPVFRRAKRSFFCGARAHIPRGCCSNPSLPQAPGMAAGSHLGQLCIPSLPRNLAPSAARHGCHSHRPIQIGSIHSLSAGNKCVKLQLVEEGRFLLPVIRSLSHNLLHRQKIIFHKPCFRSVIHSTDCTWPKPFQ